MDLKGSLVSTRLRIYPSEYFSTFLRSIQNEEDIPANIANFTGKSCKGSLNEDNAQPKSVHLSDEDLKNIKTISDYVKANIVPINGNKSPVDSNKVTENHNGKEKSGDTPEKQSKEKVNETKKFKKKKITNSENVSNKKISDNEDSIDDEKTDTDDAVPEKESDPYLITLDIDWIYTYLQNKRSKGEEVPHLHALLEGARVEMPENKLIKRNPVLEARCVKLRAQAEARAYRKMTKGVDNVRMRFPEDSISYQMKQLNRHLIAIGQFIISIFAGFMFGFKGIEWTIGHLDFGFRLLLGVMCALIIALAEIYFLAKKLNEELNIPETVQLGGPVKFVDEPKYRHLPSKPLGKDHQD